LFHITLPPNFDCDIDCDIDREAMELIDDRSRAWLCGGGVGAKERSDISKLSPKLFVRPCFVEVDTEDMTVWRVVKEWKERHIVNDKLRDVVGLFSSFYGTLWTEKPHLLATSIATTRLASGGRSQCWTWTLDALEVSRVIPSVGGHVDLTY
jgi:hypothetical protein